MLLSIDGTIIFVFISFAIFVYLMKLVCYNPITKIINQRDEYLKKNEKTLIETNSKKEEITKEFQNELSKAKFESSEMLKNAVNSSKEFRDEKIKTKKAEISNSILEFEKELVENSNDAKSKLKNEMKNYVRCTVSKVLNFDIGEVEIENSRLDEIIK